MFEFIGLCYLRKGDMENNQKAHFKEIVDIGKYAEAGASSSLAYLCEC